MIATRFRALAPLAGVTLLLVGCGSDSGSSASDWCSFAEGSDVVSAVFDSLGTDPGSIEDGIKQVKVIATQLPDKAPAEIKADAEVLSDGTLRVVSAFEDANYNLLDADLSFLDDDAMGDRMEEATANIDAYTVEKCGRSFSDDAPSDEPTDSIVTGDSTGDDGGDDGGFDPSAGTLREQLIEQFQSIGLSSEEATCIANNLDFDNPAVQSGDIAAMLDVFGQCNIDLARLGELGQG